MCLNLCYVLAYLVLLAERCRDREEGEWSFLLQSEVKEQRRNLDCGLEKRKWFSEIPAGYVCAVVVIIVILLYNEN